MSRRDTAIRVAAGTLAVIVLAWFANANSGERVDLDFLLFSIRDVSLPYVMYGAVIVGMLLVLAVGVRADLRARRQIERYKRIAGKLGEGEGLRETAGPKESKVEQEV